MLREYHWGCSEFPDGPLSTVYARLVGVRMCKTFTNIDIARLRLVNGPA
jgi:hypothetical protein